MDMNLRQTANNKLKGTNNREESSGQQKSAFSDFLRSGLLLQFATGIRNAIYNADVMVISELLLIH